MTNFNQAASPKTTARELSNELSSFAEALGESAQKLSTEVANIRQAKEEIQEEYFATVRGFVESTLADLNGEQFDVIADIAQKTPELGGQGLAFIRQKLVGARDAALEKINRTSAETIDADGFQQGKEAAEAAVEAAEQKLQEARDATKTAAYEMRTFEKTSEGHFAALNDTVCSKGAPSITPENRKYYDQTNIFAAIYNYLTRDQNYRDIRKAMVEYGHGENGKDIFAEMGAAVSKLADLKKAQAAAATAQEACVDECEKANAAADAYNEAGDTILTDAQILSTIHDKVVGYLATPEFSKAVAAQYGEDYPSSISLLAAKLTTLDKLEQGVEGKMVSLSQTIGEVTKQQRKVGRMSPYAEVGVDLDTVRRQNQVRREHYDNYATAANDGWRHTRDYVPTTTYVDNSPSFLEIMLISELLNHSHNHGSTTTTTYGSGTPYTADILGVDKSQAEQFGANASDFDALPTASQDFDIINDNGSSLNSQIDEAFGLDNNSGSSNNFGSSNNDFDIQPGASPTFDNNSAGGLNS